MANEHPIGIFDSGVGGLSVFRHIREQLPNESLLYFADQANVPYGSRPTDEIVGFSRNIARFLIGEGAKLIVVACNTATAAAVQALRDELEVPVVGMEPAVKPASEQTRTGVVAVLARSGTFQSAKYASLRQRFAETITVLEDPCQGLVELIEQGPGNDSQTADLLRQIVEPMLNADADTFILGCTHYPFIATLLQQIIGANRTIIDPSAAVARQVQRVLDKKDLLAPSDNPTRFEKLFTSGQVESLARFVETQFGSDLPIISSSGLH